MKPVDKFYNKQLLKTFALLLGAFAAMPVLAQPTSQTFNTSGTYTVPAGYSATVKIEAWGGGGGGNRSGGGGGAYASIITTLAPGNYAVTVGPGGAGRLAATNATDGGNSSFTTLVIAAGGLAGGTNTAGAGGAAAASTGTTKFSGGNGALQGTADGGGGGGSATATAVGGNATTTSPGIGQGNGGAGGTTAIPTGGNGIAPGGGGGGRNIASANGGSGAAGRVIVTVQVFLPVVFGKVEAKISGGELQVNWVALNETNNDHFEIEASKDGNEFTKIGEIATKAVNGYADQPQSYEFSIGLRRMAGILGISLLGFGFILLPFNRRKRFFYIFALLFGLALIGSCSKNESAAITDGTGKIFVRIAQVDKDGAKNYTQVFQAVKE